MANVRFVIYETKKASGRSPTGQDYWKPKVEESADAFWQRTRRESHKRSTVPQSGASDLPPRYPSVSEKSKSHGVSRALAAWQAIRCRLDHKLAVSTERLDLHPVPKIVGLEALAAASRFGARTLGATMSRNSCRKPKRQHTSIAELLGTACRVPAGGCETHLSNSTILKWSLVAPYSRRYLVGNFWRPYRTIFRWVASRLFSNGPLRMPLRRFLATTAPQTPASHYRP